VQVIKGTETDRIKEYEQVAKLRAAQNGTQTQLTGDVVINDDWNIANGFSFSNPNNDPSIQLANTQANNVLSAAVSVGKTYANQGVELAAGGALVPVGKSVIALIPIIVALFKGLKLPTAILLDTIGSLIREILLEQIRDKLRGDNAVAAVPEWWQVRLGADRPQLVILYGEKLPNDKTGRSRYPLTIPYYKFTGKGLPVFPTYQKGQWEGLLTLRDNSRIVVHAISYNEAKRVLNELKEFVDPNMRGGSTQKIGEYGGVALKTITVKPCTAKYFATGQKDTNPTYTLNL
jgi:hypothetical protein